MSTSIRIGITGYGNLGRGAEAAITQSPDLELAAIVTRRDPATVTPADLGEYMTGARTEVS